MIALRRRLIARAREQAGFGLVELLIAMTIMLVGIMALFTMFQSGMVQIRRASITSTAAALAEAEMENFRAIRYDSIGLAQVDLDAIPAEDVYKADSAYAVESIVVLPKCGTAPCTSTLPTRTEVGADGRSYRVDVFVNAQTVTNGRDVKLVTIVVRDAQDVAKTWARLVSSFDESTGI